MDAGTPDPAVSNRGAEEENPMSCSITEDDTNTMPSSVTREPSSSCDDVSPSVSDNDATGDSDVICRTAASDEEDTKQNSEERVCGTPAPISSLPSKSESGCDDVDGDAIVRVQRREACQSGSEVKVTIVSVADLAKDLPTLAKAKVEAVAVSYHFYNQWARVPRPETTAEDDVTTRRPAAASTRMFTATGSLKSYTLMNAIVRDKRSPIQSWADLFHTHHHHHHHHHYNNYYPAAPEDAATNNDKDARYDDDDDDDDAAPNAGEESF
ncbi:uncharacterized protein LOC143288200 [Babylonia areolata]|uniref:uncharacterized protein LOC143288200 n=1 Tax=Babylonia areolata TaxID=304850 RepID=UPI003FD096DE